MTKNAVMVLRYGEATRDGVNVIYWETFNGTKHFITLDENWYEKHTHPIDAMRQYAPTFSVSAYTHIEYLERMYTIPRRGSCENISGDPFKPYKED